MSVRRLSSNQPASFAFTPENAQWAKGQIAKYPDGRQASAIIPLFWQAQKQEGWLTEPAIRYVADMLKMDYMRALEVATFYTMFNLSPVGEHFVQLCGTTPCWLRGSDDLKAACAKHIGPEVRSAPTANSRGSKSNVSALAPMRRWSRSTTTIMKTSTAHPSGRCSKTCAPASL